jgi:hypothetical protein
MEIKNRKRTGRIAVLVVVALLVVVAAAGAVFAATPGALGTFQEDRLADVKAALDVRVEAGTLDPATADSLYADAQTRIGNCTAVLDGTGTPAGNAYRGGRGMAGTNAGSGNGVCDGTGTGIGYRGGTNGTAGGRGNGGVCIATVTPAA